MVLPHSILASHLTCSISPVSASLSIFPALRPSINPPPAPSSLHPSSCQTSTVSSISSSVPAFFNHSFQSTHPFSSQSCISPLHPSFTHPSISPCFYFPPVSINLIICRPPTSYIRQILPHVSSSPPSTRAALGSDPDLAGNGSDKSNGDSVLTSRRDRRRTLAAH